MIICFGGSLKRDKKKFIGFIVFAIYWCCHIPVNRHAVSSNSSPSWRKRPIPRSGVLQAEYDAFLVIMLLNNYFNPFTFIWLSIVCKSFWFFVFTHKITFKHTSYMFKVYEFTYVSCLMWITEFSMRIKIQIIVGNSFYNFRNKKNVWGTNDFLTRFY